MKIAQIQHYQKVALTFQLLALAKTSDRLTKNIPSHNSLVTTIKVLCSSKGKAIITIGNCCDAKTMSKIKLALVRLWHVEQRNSAEYIYVYTFKYVQLLALVLLVSINANWLIILLPKCTQLAAVLLGRLA